MLKLKKRNVVMLTDEDIKFVSGGRAKEPGGGNQTTYTQPTEITSDRCGGSEDCTGGGSGGCGSVWCDSHYCGSVDCNSGACGSMYCDSNVCASGNCQSYDCDSLVCQSNDCNSNVCHSVGECATEYCQGG